MVCSQGLFPSISVSLSPMSDIKSGSVSVVVVSRLVLDVSDVCVDGMVLLLCVVGVGEVGAS